MTNRIYQSAARIRDLVVQLEGPDGWPVGPLSYSTNRNGDHSAYFTWGGADVRISDHFSNTARRLGLLEIYAEADEAAVREIHHRLHLSSALNTFARFARVIAHDAEAARKRKVEAVLAEASQRRKTDLDAHLEGLDPGLDTMTQTAIAKIVKAWRKANPITRYMED